MLTIKLPNETEMPRMAIGTNWMTYHQLKPIVKAAFESGIRAIDTARDYGNEHIVGQVVKDVLSELNMKRTDIFITTKIGNRQQAKGDINCQLNISLKNLQTDYIDLWLIHWPFKTYYLNTWHQMTDIYQNSNKIKSLGVANFQLRHLQNLLNDTSILKPMVNQIEYHPLHTSTELRSFMRDNDIITQAYAPLCRLVPAIKDSNVLNNIGFKYSKTIGQIILRWHIQQGDVMPVFKTYNVNRFIENVAIYDFELSEEEMSMITGLNIDYKYHLESVSCPGY